MANEQNAENKTETWFTESGAAKYIGFSHSWAIRKINVRRYDLRSPGASRAKFRYRKSDLDAFLKQCECLPEAVSG